MITPGNLSSLSSTFTTELNSFWKRVEAQSSVNRTKYGVHRWWLGCRNPSTTGRVAYCRVCGFKVFGLYVRRTKCNAGFRFHLCCSLYATCTESAPPPPPPLMVVAV